MGKWPWPQPSGMELPAPFQALAPWAWWQPGEAGQTDLQASSTLTHAAYHAALGKCPGSRASKGLPEVIECCSCSRKGCSKPSMRKSLKPGTGQHLGAMLEQVSGGGGMLAGALGV